VAAIVGYFRLSLRLERRELLALREHHLAAVGRNRRRNGGRREARRVFGFHTCHNSRLPVSRFSFSIWRVVPSVLATYTIFGRRTRRSQSRRPSRGNFFRRAFADDQKLGLSIMNDNDGSPVREARGHGNILVINLGAAPLRSVTYVQSLGPSARPRTRCVVRRGTTRPSWRETSQCRTVGWPGPTGTI